jgi:T-complex protein 1 subunit gamma
MAHNISDFVFEAKHANGEDSWGVNGDTGKIVDMKEYGLYESASVKVRSFSPAL